MTGHQVLAENLQPGQRIHIEPHQVHGVPAGHLPDSKHAGEADAEVDAVRIVGTLQCEVVVECHPCYCGAAPGELWCTTYHKTDPVLVIGGSARSAA